MSSTSPLAALQDALFRAAASLRDDLAAEEIPVLVGHFVLLKLVEEELVAAERGAEARPFGPKLFSRQAARYRWSRWNDLPAEDLAAFLDDEVFPYLASLVLESPLLASYFQGLRVHGRLASAVRLIVDTLDGVALLSIPSGEVAGAWDALCERSAADRGLYEYRTPRAVCDLMIGCANPQPGERLFDPCCGGGALLGSALDRMAALSLANPVEAVQSAAWGIERNESAFRRAVVQLALRGVRTKTLRLADALAAELAPDALPMADVVLLDPPIGTRLEPGSMRGDLTPYARRSEAAFVALASTRLGVGGRLVAALPASFLMASDLATSQLRKQLLASLHVSAVIRLAPKAYAARGMSIDMFLLVAQSKSDLHRSGFVQFFEMRNAADASELLATFNELREGGFQSPVGPEALSELPPDAPSPLTWWASEETIHAQGDVLLPERYRPTVASAYSAGDVRETLRAALELQRQVSDGVAALLREIEAEP
jgi:hypothetical protein